MYYILTLFYCDFCLIKKYGRQKSYSFGAFEEAAELVCEDLVYTWNEVLYKLLLSK